MTTSPRTFLILAVSVVALGASTLTANATTPPVPCDSGQLAAAVTAANTDPDPNTIQLTAGCTYTFTSGSNGNALLISQPLTIVGNGATILRNAATQFRIFDIVSGISVTMSHLTVTGGRALDGAVGFSGSPGGGILNAGTLTLKSVNVQGNIAGSGMGNRTPPPTGGDGGGISNERGATLTLVGGSVSSDQAGIGGGYSGSSYEGGAGGNGGGIANDGTLHVQGTTFAYNVAGRGGDTDLAGNGGNGGAISNGAAATATIVGGTVSSNHAGAGGGSLVAYEGGAGGSGGGISNDGTLHVQGTKLQSNVAGSGGQGDVPGAGGNGGGIVNLQYRTATIRSVVITSDHAGTALVPAQPGTGGGIEDLGLQMTAVKSTIKNNSPDNCRPAGTVKRCSG